MKYVTTVHKDGTVSLEVYFGPDKNSDCVGMRTGYDGVVPGVDLMSEQLMKKAFGFTKHDMTISIFEALKK
jgi:hypothetical protein